MRSERLGGRPESDGIVLCRGCAGWLTRMHQTTWQAFKSLQGSACVVCLLGGGSAVVRQAECGTRQVRKVRPGRVLDDHEWELPRLPRRHVLGRASRNRASTAGIAKVLFELHTSTSTSTSTSAFV